MAPDKDTYKFQTERLRKLVSDHAPGKEIRFGNQLGLISFRIIDPPTGTVLVEKSGEWVPSVLADKSDEQLWVMIRQFSNGKL
jgi:hypothetical protein